MKRSVLLVTVAAVLASGSPGLSQSTVPPRVLREMNAVQGEILRRDPSARVHDGYDAANVDPGAGRIARGMSDAELAQAYATYVRMTGARSSPSASAAGPSVRAETARTAPAPAPAPWRIAQSAPKPVKSPETAPPTAQSKPAGKHEAYCKPFWAQARTDCFMRDRESFSCPIIAANRYEQCLKTGKWY